MKHTFILLYFHPFILSFFHPFILSSFHPTILSSFHSFILSFHPFILHSFILSFFTFINFPFIFSSFHFFILSSFVPFILLCFHPFFLLYSSFHSFLLSRIVNHSCFLISGLFLRTISPDPVLNPPEKWNPEVFLYELEPVLAPGLPETPLLEAHLVRRVLLALFTVPGPPSTESSQKSQSVRAKRI